MKADEKYSEALKLYATTDMTIKQISLMCGVTRSGFANYIQRCHRDLMYRRHGLVTAAPANKMWNAKGQTPGTHKKYRDAILACDSVEYIDLNVSQIARKFNLEPTGLSNQLKTHFPEIIQRREEERRRRGIADNLHRGARPSAVVAYSEAVRLLAATDMTIEEVADLCDVSFTGLRQHLLLYHKDLVAARENKRIEGKKLPKVGKICGNGSIRKASDEDYRKFAEAVRLYRSTSLTMKDICAATGNNLQAFRNHMRVWHKNLMFERRGASISSDESDRSKLNRCKRYNPASAEKYAPAITRLKEGHKTVEEIAREYGFIPEVFRSYIKEHHFELWQKMGMTLLPNGRKVLKRSSDKYAEAIELYRTSTESLKSIAERLDISYKSVSSFIHRNMPDIIAQHNALIIKP